MPLMIIGMTTPLKYQARVHKDEILKASLITLYGHEKTLLPSQLHAVLQVFMGTI